MLYITTCSKEKSGKTGEIPALERYDSSRIRGVYQMSQLHESPFYILSGKFGLLAPEHPIPWYDKALQPEDVASLVPIVTAQLREIGDNVLFFAKHPEEDSTWQPYLDALQKAAENAGIELKIAWLE